MVLLPRRYRRRRLDLYPDADAFFSARTGRKLWSSRMISSRIADRMRSRRLPVDLPELGYEWALAGLSEVLMELGDRYPECEPDLTLEISEVSPTVARWNTLGPGITYDLIRGSVGAMRAAGGLVDLGVVTCLENDSSDLSNRGLGDAAVPPVGQGFFYLVRQTPKGSGLGYGTSSAHEPRQPAAGDCL